MTVERYATNFTYVAGGTINYTGTAANSGNLPNGIAGCFVTCETSAWARLAPVVNVTAPVAVTTDWFCPLGSTVFIPNTDQSGAPLQLSVIRDSASGAARYNAVA